MAVLLVPTLHAERIELPSDAELEAAIIEESKALTITPGGRVGDDARLGTPGGRQNWVDRAGGLPRYIRIVANALRRRGMSTSRAIAVAVATMRRWARGGGKVSPKVRAAAARAVAQWEAMRARARAD
jgi:hypothetical protein